MQQTKSTLRTAAPASRAAPLQDLLVLMDDGAAAANALAYAESLAPEGNVAALMFGVLPDFPISEGAAEAWMIAERAAKADALEAEMALRARLSQTGSRAELRRVDVTLGGESGALAEQGLYADLTLIGWPTAPEAAPAAALFEAVLFDSGRPILLVPEACQRRGPPDTILVAWSPTREAARAVNDALPLLKAASTVRIVVVAENGGGREDNPGDDIARHLARHNVRVDVRHVPAGGGTISKVLLDEARFAGADLLVMGGYSHSRTGEWLFGGVTRDMLGRTTVPVLMSH